jgi:type VI secretion system protein ImpJ
VPDPRCFDPRARWYLSVRSSIGPAETAVRVPALVKACRSQFIVKLVQRAFPGLPLAHVPAPPPSIAPRADRAYFEITTVGPCMEGLAESREFGAYVPDRIPDASLELIVLAPG